MKILVATLLVLAFASCKSASSNTADADVKGWGDKKDEDKPIVLGIGKDLVCQNNDDPLIFQLPTKSSAFLTLPDNTSVTMTCTKSPGNPFATGRGSLAKCTGKQKRDTYNVELFYQSTMSPMDRYKAKATKVGDADVYPLNCREM